ncbi:DUF6911 family protein [Paraburkholderia ferrariae]|uniref:DUF6911 family protein n=1 Tax=Paraburkholderia ferrariae TaxID=386056 RepID=UPI0012EBE507|nr:hypothetical protein [Paraburkholderia ferrariae]
MNGMIGGYVVRAGAKRDALSPVYSPDLSTVERLIELFNEQDGVVVLRVVTTATTAPPALPAFCELALYAEHGLFVLLLNAMVGDEAAAIDLPGVDGLDCGFVSMPGDSWARRAVTRDFAVVRQTFRAMAGLGTRARA